MSRPCTFIASSTEGRRIAEAFQECLQPVAQVTIWNQNVFAPGDHLLGSILEASRTFEFGIFVLTPDDLLTLRGGTASVSRDNVGFELGVFMGRLGSERVFIVGPDVDAGFHLPSDLAGITTSSYDARRTDGNLLAAVAPAARSIADAIATRKANGRSGYLVRYEEQEERSLTATPETHVTADRAYRFLLHMLRRESYDRFYAFDLAFERWQELISTENAGQTFNVSNEIFDAVGAMLREGRCRRLKRILVVTMDQLGKPTAIPTLERFRQQEAAWHAETPDVEIETRVLIYPQKDTWDRNDTRTRIGRVHDFAVFTGELDQVAIVETTLTAPTDRVDSPECLISTEGRKVQDLQTAFDEFWRGGNLTLDEVLRTLRQAKAHDTASHRPAAQALGLLKDEWPRALPASGAVVIEAQYLDLRSPGDEDRMRHLDEAFWLFDEICSAQLPMSGPILLDGFINNLSAEACNIETCSVPVDGDDGDGLAELMAQVKRGLLDRRPPVGKIDSDDVELFGMRSTRNKVARHLTRLLRDRHPAIVKRGGGDLTVDLYAEGAGEPILLGHKDADTGIVPRCSALMAQHYWDVCQFAFARRGSLRSLWIIDFNRLAERESVRLGAEAAAILYAWPPGFQVNIVNCIYPSGNRPGSIHRIAIPS